MGGFHRFLVAAWAIACLRTAPTTAQDLYSLIPPPTDFYRTLNVNDMAEYFGRKQIRYSMTVIHEYIYKLLLEAYCH